MAPGAGAGNQHRIAWEGFRVAKTIPGHMTPLAPAGDRSPGLETFRLPKVSLPRMPGRPYTGTPALLSPDKRSRRPSVTKSERACQIWAVLAWAARNRQIIT